VGAEIQLNKGSYTGTDMDCRRELVGTAMDDDFKQWIPGQWRSQTAAGCLLGVEMKHDGGETDVAGINRGR